MPAIVCRVIASRVAGGEPAIPARICAATGSTLSGVALAANMAPMKGIMSTTITFDTASGRRAAIIIANVPPSEWPTSAGRFSRCVAM